MHIYTYKQHTNTAHIHILMTHTHACTHADIYTHMHTRAHAQRISYYIRFDRTVLSVIGNC